MNDKSKTIRHHVTAHVLRLRAVSFYAGFWSGAWALLVGLAIQHSVLGADQPEPSVRQSAVDMTVTQDETVMTVTGPTRPMRSSGM